LQGFTAVALSGKPVSDAELSGSKAEGRIGLQHHSGVQQQDRPLAPGLLHPVPQPVH
jgi:hypothetical protein